MKKEVEMLREQKNLFQRQIKLLDQEKDRLDNIIRWANAKKKSVKHQKYVSEVKINGIERKLKELTNVRS